MGILEDLVLDEQTISVPEGSMILLYTDGVIDARHSDGESFGMERLIKTLGHLSPGSAQDQCDQLWQILCEFQSKEAQEDDVTIMAVKSTR
jgi:sigma-B regulation protein RsbU (phosphoserine phosphatase)